MTKLLTYNWDNKLRSAQKGSSTISLRYDPSGNRVWKKSGSSANKLIVDVVGDLPTILLELNTSTSAVNRAYVYANSQIVMQHDVVDNNKKYFYLHDRRGEQL